MVCLLEGRGEGERANEGRGENGREDEEREGTAGKKTFHLRSSGGSVCECACVYVCVNVLERRPCR